MARFFEDMNGIDDNLREAILKQSGEPPDDFIEDAQGGGLDGDEIVHESPAERQAFIRALDQDLVRLVPALASSLQDGELRQD